MPKDEWHRTMETRAELVSLVGLRTWDAMSARQCDDAVRYAAEHGKREAARMLRESAATGGR
jgi:hypothetical protein